MRYQSNAGAISILIKDIRENQTDRNEEVKTEDQ